MPHDSVSELNLAYSRLERQNRGAGKFRLFVVAGESGRKATNLVSRALRQQDFVDLGPAENLRILLRVIAADFRGFCAPGEVAEEYWAHKQGELQSGIQAITGFLAQSVTAALDELAQHLIEWGTASSREMFAVLDSEVTKREGEVALALSTPRLSNQVASWVPAWFGDGKVVVARALTLRNLDISKLESVIWIGPPHRFFRRPELEKLARALCLAGMSEDVSFIAPRWACSAQEESALLSLFPLPPANRLPKIQPIAAGRVDLEFVVADEIEDEDSGPVQDEVPTSVPLLRSGTTPCRLLHLGMHFSLPVEEDASRVTAISKNAISDRWEAYGKNPFSDLQEGDFVLAIIDSSETTDLRRRAGLAMDEKHPHYERAQNSWKSKLAAVAQELGRSTLESRLKSAGISSGHRFPYWLEPTTISPQTNEDFRILLSFLGLSKVQVVEVMELTKEFRAHLIAEGLRAGMEVVRMLNDEEREPHYFANGRTVVLEELGNAKYLVAPVTSVDSAVVLCDPSQVRSLVARNKDVAG